MNWLEISWNWGVRTVETMAIGWENEISPRFTRTNDMFFKTLFFKKKEISRFTRNDGSSPCGREEKWRLRRHFSSPLCGIKPSFRTQ